MNFNIETPTGARTINIVLPQKPYGVLVSGGVDSSLMLCLVLMTRQAEVSTVPFIALNVRRGFGTERFSEAMLERVAKHFGVAVPFMHLDLPEGTHHSECLRVPLIPLLDKRKLVQVFAGDTSNPDIPEQGPDRTPVSEQFKSVRWSLPLLHCDKSHTVALIRQLGLNFIETSSHTCVALDEYRCRTCFQCQERAWAYRTLGLTDPGEH